MIIHTELTSQTQNILALQRLPRRFLRHSWAIRVDGLFTDPDEPTECQGVRAQS